MKWKCQNRSMNGREMKAIKFNVMWVHWLWILMKFGDLNARKSQKKVVCHS